MPEIQEGPPEIAAAIQAVVDASTDLIEMPIASEWVLLVAVDSVADRAQGCVRMLTPPWQFKHRTIGLLQAAKDELTALSCSD